MGKKNLHRLGRERLFRLLSSPGKRKKTESSSVSSASLW